jgi:hypothetical protein
VSEFGSWLIGLTPILQHKKCIVQLQLQHFAHLQSSQETDLFLDFPGNSLSRKCRFAVVFPFFFKGMVFSINLSFTFVCCQGAESQMHDSLQDPAPPKPAPDNSGEKKGRKRKGGSRKVRFLSSWLDGNIRSENLPKYVTRQAAGKKREEEKRTL